MQDWFYVQSAEYGRYYISVEINGYDVYKVSLYVQDEPGSHILGYPYDETITGKKEYAKRRYKQFMKKAEEDDYGMNSYVEDPTWVFDQSDWNSTQQYIFSSSSNPSKSNGSNHTNNNLPVFATLDDAKEYFQEQREVSQKYGLMLCYVGDTYTCLMGTAMAEDDYTRGPIEEVVEKFLGEIKAPIDVDDAIHYCGAEMTNTLYHILSQYGVDVEFVYDTF